MTPPFDGSSRAPVPDPGRGPSLRREGDALAASPIGTVPILWTFHEAETGQPASPEDILDDIARAGYEGTQLGSGFPEGAELRMALAGRGLRLAEVYAALPATAAGLGPDALAVGRERLRLLDEGGGDVLCVALDGSPDRESAAGRADDPSTPRLADPAWLELADVLHQLADAAISGGHRLAFHPHAATFVETADELERLLAVTDARRIGVCLDVGHWIVGGGDPVAAIRRLGARLTHVHLKDVDPDVHADLRRGTLPSLEAATRARIFTELGSGVLDLPGCLRALRDVGYAGWLMVEQDSSWLPPSEAATIGRQALARALTIGGSDRPGDGLP